MRHSNSFIKDLIYEPARLKKCLVVVAITAFIFVCIFVYFSDSSVANPIPEVSKTDSEPITEVEPSEIIVDVGGAVVTPGVYTLAVGCRIFQAIESAGGLTEEADTKEINQAAVIADGDRIYIPTSREVTDGYVGGSQSNSGNIPGGNSKVNINTADSAGLQVLSGVGPATAEKIIDYRNSNGKFTSIEKLKNVSGIGDKTYLKLKDNICV